MMRGSGGAGIDRPRTHGQPDRRRCEFCAVRFRVCEVGKSRSAKVRRFDRIGDSVLSGGNANANREDAGRTSRSPIFI